MIRALAFATAIGVAGSLGAGLLGAALSALGLPGGGVAHAQARLGLDEALTRGSPSEEKALVSLEQGKFARARTEAEAVLAQGASFLATYVLAKVFAEAEGNHARALFLMRRAERMLVAAHGTPPLRDPEAARWHRRILRETIFILSDMDRRVEQIAEIDRYDSLFRPSVDYMKIWPLLKLGRYDEAREIGRKHLYSDDPNARHRAYNGLMAVEDEARNRRASYDWGKRGHEALQGQSCIIASNLALAARRLFKLDEAEKYDKAALKTTDGSCPTSPYHQLTTTYLIRAEYQRSISALDELRKIPRTADLRVQNEMMIKARFVELLFALGQIEEAASRARQIIDAPDRAGTTSADAGAVLLGHVVLYAAVLDARIAQLQEQVAARSFWEGLKLWPTLRRLELERWEIRRMAVRLASRSDYLAVTVRPYYTDVLPWYAPALRRIFGEGVLRAAVGEGRAADEDAPEHAGAYYDAYDGEVAFANGRLAEAIRFGEQALAAFPRGEVLAALRVRAWLADALERSGRADAARTHREVVLQQGPGFIRLLGLALPVRVEAEGGAHAAETASRLADSPRFRRGDAGLEVAIREVEDTLEVCLYGPASFRYACVETPLAADPAETAVAALDAFHLKAFAPRVELTQTDINSLDGAPQRLEAKRAVQRILGGMDEK